MKINFKSAVRLCIALHGIGISIMIMGFMVVSMASQSVAVENRVTVNLNAGWKFTKGDFTGAEPDTATQVEHHAVPQFRHALLQLRASFQQDGGS